MQEVDSNSQEDLSGGRSSFAYGQASNRLLKAAKIVAILEKHCELEGASMLDIGTGSGHMAKAWAAHCGRLHSVDVSDQRVVKDGYQFSCIESEVLPFESASFDVVVSNQVLEHVWDQETHLAEIARVLKPNGVAYLSTPNRFCLIEPHYRLPLLAWLGDAFACRYLRFLRRQEWDVKLLSFRALRRKLEVSFSVTDCIPMVMQSVAFFANY